MTAPFDMALFMNGVLKGAHAIHQRHLNQARIIQAAIQQHWQLDNPWTWQAKHLRWFLLRHLEHHSPQSRYYYGLTVLLIVARLGRCDKWKRYLRLA